MQFFFFIDFALRDLFKSRVMFILITVSIALTTIAILSTSSVLLGFTRALQAGNHGWLADIVITSAYKDREEIIHAEDLLRDIKKQPNVFSVTERSYATGGLKQHEKWTLPSQIVGINVKDERDVSLFHKEVVEGRFLKDRGPTDEIVIGVDVANSLVGGTYDDRRAHVGDSLLLRNDAGEIKKYVLVGIIDAKTFMPNSMVFLDKNEVETFLLGAKNSQIIVKLTDNSASAVTKVKQTLQSAHPELLVQTSEESAGFVQDILGAISFIVTIINTLLIFVVFFIVNIVMYISVREDKRQIGILKSIGCTNSFIVTLNVVKALIYGLLAYSLGLFVYIILYGISSQNPYPLLIGDFKMELSSSQMIFSLLLVVGGVLFGSFIPSVIAAKTSIIDVIRESD